LDPTITAGSIRLAGAWQLAYWRDFAQALDELSNPAFKLHALPERGVATERVRRSANRLRLPAP
jgi:hypothetical protein